jgi:hypothetical protein
MNDYSETREQSNARLRRSMKRQPVLHSRIDEGNTTRARLKARGQSAVFITLAIFVIIGIVGLAIDGGGILNNRREAQNAVDGAAMAGGRLMLQQYEAMALGSPIDIPGTAGQEDAIRSRIESYAGLNGIITSTLEVYFVNQNKQIVTAHVGEGACGLVNPCQVGRNNMVPWTLGATGITVRGKVQSDSFFMSTLGFDTLSAAASTVAYMGVAIDSPPELGIIPIGFFTETQYLNRMQPGVTYTLINGDTRYGSGNNGWVDFNGRSANAHRTKITMACGYNPALRTQEQWNQWCPAEAGVAGLTGPTKYWTGWPNPVTGPLEDYRLQWGPGITGWWVPASTGVSLSNCENLADFIELTPGEFVIPIFDASSSDGGANVKYHLLGLSWFRISSADVDCHAIDHSTIPPISYERWFISGELLYRYSPGSNGRHGNLRSSSLHVVFLQP